MSAQLDLKYSDEEGLVRADHPVTSFEAADKTDAKTKRIQVHQFLIGRKQRGATDEEMQHALHMNGSTQRPRRVKLVEMGLIVASGEKRKTQHGRQSIVWVAK